MLSPVLTPKSIWSYNPIPGGCVLYLPLWHPSLSGPVFKSADPFGHICTVTGALYKGDKLGRWFDHSDDLINCGHHSAFNFTDASNFTVIVWMKTDTDFSGGEVSIISKWEVAANPRMRIAIETDNSLRFDISDGANTDFVDPATDPTDNAWHFIVAIYESGVKLEFLMDTVSLGTDVVFNAGDFSTTDDLVIGNRDGGGSAYSEYVGEVWIYNRVLAIAEQTHIYNVAKGRYL